MPEKRDEEECPQVTSTHPQLQRQTCSGLEGLWAVWESGQVTYIAGDLVGKCGGRSWRRSALPKHCFEKPQWSVRRSEASTRKELRWSNTCEKCRTPPLEIPNVCEHILGCETFCSKDLFSTVFHPACLQCIWWQNTVSKEHILGNTELSFLKIQDPGILNIPSKCCSAPLQPPDSPH